MDQHRLNIVGETIPRRDSEQKDRETGKSQSPLKYLRCVSSFKLGVNREETRIISILMNTTCICYFYGHGCLNTSKGVIDLLYFLLSVFVPQIFFSNSVSHYYTCSSLWHFLQLLTSCTLQATIYLQVSAFLIFIVTVGDISSLL